jgi:hypothetical protein
MFAYEWTNLHKYDIIKVLTRIARILGGITMRELIEVARCSYALAIALLKLVLFLLKLPIMVIQKTKVFLDEFVVFMDTNEKIKEVRNVNFPITFVGAVALIMLITRGTMETLTTQLLVAAGISLLLLLPVFIVYHVICFAKFVWTKIAPQTVVH